MDASSPNRTYCCPVGFPCRARRGAVRFDTMRGGIGLVRWLAGTLAAASCSITSFSAYSPPPARPPARPLARPPTCLPMHVWAYGIQHWASRLTDGEEADRSSGGPSQALSTRRGGATAVQHGTTCCNPYKMVRHRASQGKLSESEARRIFQQIIAGIDYCHQASMALAQHGMALAQPGMAPAQPSMAPAQHGTGPAWHWPGMALARHGIDYCHHASGCERMDDENPCSRCTTPRSGPPEPATAISTARTAGDARRAASQAPNKQAFTVPASEDAVAEARGAPRPQAREPPCRREHERQDRRLRPLERHRGTAMRGRALLVFAVVTACVCARARACGSCLSQRMLSSIG